jgi:hypothetical protein
LNATLRLFQHLFKLGLQFRGQLGNRILDPLKISLRDLESARKVDELIPEVGVVLNEFLNSLILFSNCIIKSFDLSDCKEECRFESGGILLRGWSSLFVHGRYGFWFWGRSYGRSWGRSYGRSWGRSWARRGHGRSNR